VGMTAFDADVLGLVHGFVGVLQQGFEVVRVVGRDGDTDACSPVWQLYLGEDWPCRVQPHGREDDPRRSVSVQSTEIYPSCLVETGPP
jgi:hypothetical protein